MLTAVMVVLSVILVVAAATLVVAVSAGVLSPKTNRIPASSAAASLSPAGRTGRSVSPVRLAGGSSGRVLVERDRRPLWQVRGWRRVGGRLVGAFRTPRGSCAGEIEVGLGLGDPEFYIVNPPAALLNGRHSACFRARGGGRYWIHFSVPRRDVDSGIAAVEALLLEALS